MVLRPSQGYERARLLFSINNETEVVKQLKGGGLKAELRDRQVSVRDPDGNMFVLRSGA